LAKNKNTDKSLVQITALRHYNNANVNSITGCVLFYVYNHDVTLTL